MCSALVLISCFGVVGEYRAEESSDNIERVQSAIEEAGGDSTKFDLRDGFNYIVYQNTSNSYVYCVGFPNDTSGIATYYGADSNYCTITLMTSEYYSYLCGMDDVDYYESALDDSIYYAIYRPSTSRIYGYVEYENCSHYYCFLGDCEINETKVFYSDVDIYEVYNDTSYEGVLENGRLFYSAYAEPIPNYSLMEIVALVLSAIMEEPDLVLFFCSGLLIIAVSFLNALR